MWPWPWCWRGPRGRKRRGRPAWTGRRSGTGCTATTPRASPACATGPGRGASRALPGARGRIGGGGGAGAGPGPGRRRALASRRPAGADRGPLRGPPDERTVGKVLAGSASPAWRCGPRPEGGRGGAGGVQKSFAELVREALPERARGKPVEVWFQDEARVGQQGTLTRVWARRGTRPRAPRDRRYAWACLFGAVCPERAVGAGLVLPCRHRGCRPAPGRDRPARHAGRAAVVVPTGRVARGRRPRRPREPHPPAAAALQPRVEPGRERVGVPAPEQARPARLARLRGHRRHLLRRLELLLATPDRLLVHPPEPAPAQCEDKGELRRPRNALRARGRPRARACAGELPVSFRMGTVLARWSPPALEAPVSLPTLVSLLYHFAAL